jgi:hypothetical protein
MSSLIPIAKVRRQRLQNEVRACLRNGLDVDMLGAFLASVDWSGAGTIRPKIADDLGKLEAWITQYTESFVSRPEFIARLLTLLPERERNWALFFPDEPTVIKVVSWFGHVNHPVLLRSALPDGVLQTGSGSPVPTVPSAPSSDTVLAA